MSGSGSTRLSRSRIRSTPGGGASATAVITPLAWPPPRGTTTRQPGRAAAMAGGMAYV